MEKRPCGYLELIAPVFLLLGAIFTLLGLAGLVIFYPVRSGERWMFLAYGLPLLLAGGVCALAARRRHRAREELRRRGCFVSGRAASVRRHDFVHWTSGGFNIQSPWTILCQYQYEGQTYTVRSTFLWDEPVGQSAKIFLDQERPKRAWIDPSSLEYKMKLR